MNQDYEAKFKVGDKIRLYGKETTIRGFYISYNDALNKYETIMLTDGRGDPFERSLDAIEWLDESINQEDSLKDSDWKEKFNDWMSRYFEGQYTPKGMAADLARQWIEENVIAPLLEEKRLNEDIIRNEHSIMVNAEQRGHEKAKQESNTSSQTLTQIEQDKKL